MTTPEVRSLSGKEIADLIASGITQNELRRKTSKTSRDISRLAMRMERKNLIVRTEILKDGRHTYELKPHPGVSVDTIGTFLDEDFNRPRGPNLDFVAPSLSPLIERAVELRSQGLTMREISQQMGRTVKTVELYLRYARRPELFYRDKMIQREKVVIPDQRVIMTIRNIMADRGFMFTDEVLDGIGRGTMMTVIHYLLANNELKEATFVGAGRAFRIWELYGPLAKRHVVYFEPAKLANYIIETLKLSPNLSRNLRSALSRSIGEVFFNDSIVLNTLRQSMRSSN